MNDTTLNYILNMVVDERMSAPAALRLLNEMLDEFERRRREIAATQARIAATIAAIERHAQPMERAA